MRRRTFALFFALCVACGSSYTTDPASDAGTTADAGLSQLDAGASSPDAGVARLTPPPGWSYGRFVALTSDAPTALSDHAVLVVLPSSFDYANAAAMGADLRFQLPGTAADLAYFVETWVIGGESHVWVRTPSVPTGKSALAMYYGNANATPASSFTTTFPAAIRTAGGGVGNTTVMANVDTDWYEVRAGDTVTIPNGVPWKVSARRIIIAGSIAGDAHGYAGATGSFSAGSGPGAGQPSPAKKSASSGGGYGGAGGPGGADAAETPSVGGLANGTASGDDIDMGSGGASGNGKAGGTGGGAITLLGWKTTVSGAIHADGATGEGLSGQNAGGGAGGGVLIATCYLDMNNATVSAAGGAGGACGATANDCGGGGGGGRIKLRRRSEGAFAPPTQPQIVGGAGGMGGGSTTTGKNGENGTTDTAQSSTLLKGVTTLLGSAQKF